MESLRGNAVVGQSGGPTSAINATLCGVISAALESDHIDTLYGSFYGIDGILNGNFCDLTERFSGENGKKDIEILKTTPAAALGSCRTKLPVCNGNKENSEVFEKIFSFFEKHNIRYFFYIGGNDSMDTVAKISDYAKKCGYDIRVMGIPKTIDNDIVNTDHTPGFGSAAKYIAASVSEIIHDCSVYTTKAVTIVEIMGRDAGWLTAAAALTRVSGQEPDLIYLPEKPFDFESFYKDIERIFKTKKCIVIAVSEGLRTADGKYVGESSQSGISDVFGHKYLSGTGKALELAVKEKFGCKVRSVEINILQRCAAHCASAADIRESAAIGYAAVAEAVNGTSGKMMTFVRDPGNEYSCSFSDADISEIANKVRTVPDEFINADGNGITDKCVNYLLPLIDGESFPEYKNGLPVYLNLK